MTNGRDLFVSVDIETAGPIPGEYSLLAIGACLIDAPERTFLCYLQPLNTNADPAALKVTGLSLQELERTGLAAEQAMTRFATWLEANRSSADRLVFVGLNAPFDWSFVNYYFHQFVGENPFGFTALDIKAYYMGASGVAWTESTSSGMAEAFGIDETGDHNALHDALYQAELFRQTRNQVSSRDLGGGLPGGQRRVE
ncbi:MAG: 3'-5' exonuclease [Chloroflexi bacterium]|nr:3'-5' exonuclease [Chloroflexota bacterium]